MSEFSWLQKKLFPMSFVNIAFVSCVCDRNECLPYFIKDLYKYLHKKS